MHHSFVPTHYAHTRTAYGEEVSGAGAMGAACVNGVGGYRQGRCEHEHCGSANM